jgi:hypothetical protein
MAKLNKKKINLYYKRLNLSNISYFYKLLIKLNYLFDITFFYWIYRKPYNRTVQGLSIKVKKNFYTNMESFLLYYKYKNIRVNQIFFKNSPFNLIIRKKKSKSYTKLYIL